MCVLDSENLSVSGARVGRWEINRPGNLSRAPKDGTFTMFFARHLSRTPDKSHGELTSTALISFKKRIEKYFLDEKNFGTRDSNFLSILKFCF